MARALHLADGVLGRVSPNPAVGAVIVKDGRVVGEGATRPPGQAHAEVVALDGAAELARGATLYVTLEPCAHHGRTPPCANAIVAAGIARVEAATIDSSPWVDGAGVAALERAGIAVALGRCEREARRLNEAYFAWIDHGRPFVTATYALGLDGGFLADGLAGLDDAGRAEVERLRRRADRVVRGGADALLADDPELTASGAAGVTSVLVECEPGDLTRLLRTGLADKLVVFVHPELGHAPLGGASALPAPSLVRDLSYERLGDTLMIVGYRAPCSRES